jgi:hypothetical protein
LRVGARLIASLAQIFIHIEGQRVARLRPVENEMRNVAARLENRVVGQGEPSQKAKASVHIA